MSRRTGAVLSDAARTFSPHARIKPNRIYDPHKYRHDVQPALEITVESRETTYRRPLPPRMTTVRLFSLRVIRIIANGGWRSSPHGNYFNGVQCDENLLLNRVQSKRLRVDRVHA